MKRERERALSALRDTLGDPYKRLNCLYKIKDVQGNVITFRMNPEQQRLYKGMHTLNIIPKSRKVGFTTFVQIYILDTCLFRPNTSCGVIAHTRDDAQRFFRDMIKFAYDNLPGVLKDRITADGDNTSELLLSNGSRIKVSSSARSDTLQILHISELGHLSLHNPARAEEVVAGSLNTVAGNGRIFIESTSEGPYGVFFELIDKARKRKGPITAMDYKIHFSPWWRSDLYRLSSNVAITEEMGAYFRKIESSEKMTLDRAQKNWYIKKHEVLGTNRMYKEFPSSLDEAFQGTLDGVIYREQLNAARDQRRICRVPFMPGYPVNTFWDLGRRDCTSIWFHQRIGAEDRFIRHYENAGKSLDHYATELRRLHDDEGYIYGAHYLPHDCEIIDLSRSDNLNRRQVLESLGVVPTVTVPRIPHEQDGIEMLRQAFANCFFDEKNCADGLKALAAFRYEWDDKRQAWGRKPRDDWAAHAADALRQFAQDFDNSFKPGYNAGDDHPMLRANRPGNRMRRAKRPARIV